MSSSISVVIPAYNAEDTISRALESVADQVHPAYEVIVVDDGSKDNTCNVVSRFPLVRYIYQDNGGAAAARNLGIQYSTGKFIAFLDSDDYWRPCHLSDALESIEKAQAVWGFTAVKMPERYYERGKKSWEYLIKKNCYFENFFSAWGAEAPFHMNGMVIKREVFCRLGGFNTQLEIGEDLDLVFRIGYQHPKVAFSPKICVVYNRQMPSSLIAKHGAQSRVYMYLLEQLAAFASSMSNKDKKEFLAANQRLARFLWGAWYHHHGDLSYLRMLLSKGIDLPLKIKMLVWTSVRFPSFVRLARRAGSGIKSSLTGIRI